MKMKVTSREQDKKPVDNNKLKSFLTALLEVLIMLRSERFAQHAIGGKTREIAGIVKRETEQLIKASPLLAKYFKLTRDRLTCLINDCFMKALSGEANNINGLLLTSYIVDEVANMETQDIIGALKLSQMSVRGSRLAIYISTQYDLEYNAFNELIDYHKKCLDGAVELPDNVLSLLFELDEGDDYTDESNWIKASPLQMTFENGRQFLRGEFKKGLEVPTTMREFRIKILNERISGVATESFLPLQDIQKGRIKEEEFDWRGKEVYLGVDLSQTTDNTSVSMVHYDKTKEEFYSKTWAFIPEDCVYQKSKIEKIPYHTFIEQGYCFACGDRVISYKFVEDFVSNLESKYGVIIKGIGYDRFNCVSSANKWADKGYSTIEVKQHSTILNGGTKLLKEAILQNRFFYIRNRLLEINFANTRTMYDTNLNQYIHKKKSTGKIDMVAAMLNAMVLWNYEIEEGQSVYEERDLVIL